MAERMERERLKRKGEANKAGKGDLALVGEEASDEDGDDNDLGAQHKKDKYN